MFFKREISEILKSYVKFPVVAILGPRQSGKTTLAKNYFNNYTYVDLDNIQIRQFAQTDPQAFLGRYENKHGVIIDEFQNVPELLNYIKIIVDEKKRPGYFVLTGSQNFLMNQAITQSLAGRVGILTLLPLSILEIKDNNLTGNLDQLMFNGFYPRVYEEQIDPLNFYPSYVRSYIERDVRELTNIGDILIFQKFMRLCAARNGQEINVSELAMHTGVDQRVINKWLSVLAESYVIFFLKPYFNNFNKRLVKKPKLYFYDTGLICSLLDVKSKNALELSSYRGSIFESMIISDLQKQFFNLGQNPSTYFWRDQNGILEVDCIIDRGDKLFNIEIKSGETISSEYFKSITKFNEISNTNPQQNIIIYAGNLNQPRSLGHVIPWLDSGELIKKLLKT